MHSVRLLLCTHAWQEAERERVRLVEVAEERKKRVEAEEKAALMARKAAEHKERIEAARAGSIARDAQIMQRQREARRRRVYEDMVKLKCDFDAMCEVKLKENVERQMEATKRWLESDPQAPFRVQKELQVLKRKFYAAPTPETAELERALRDPSNAIFAHMANLLYKENKTLHTFFHQFDKEVCILVEGGYCQTFHRFDIRTCVFGGGRLGVRGSGEKGGLNSLVCCMFARSPSPPFGLFARCM